MAIRPATPADAEMLVTLIRALAEYEKLAHEAVPGAEALRRHLGPEAHPRCEAFIAEVEGQAVGFALYFFNYSTFLTKWGVYLEDLYVSPEHRGSGIGFALLKRVAERAVSIGAGRMEWAVLDWNEPAIGFYKKLGARPLDDWTVMRLTGEALTALGAPESLPAA